MTSDKIPDLDWQAFCYLTGELSAVEVEAFEARLADDQCAREALARAVELTQLVAAAETSSTQVAVARSRAQVSWQTRLAWMAVGGLASLVVGMLWSGTLQRMMTNRFSAGGTQDQLAAAWSETRAQSPLNSEPDLWPLEFSSGGDLDDEQVAYVDVPMDEVVEETPSWLDAAVLGSGGQSVDDSQPTSDSSSGD